MASLSEVIAEDLCNNSNTERCGEDADDEAVHVHARKSFRVDTSKIESVPHCQQNAELQDLDLHVYNQDTFERGCLTFAVFCMFLCMFLCYEELALLVIIVSN